MLRRWDDSQRFLADMPQLISEETANFLILWCIKLQREGVCSRLLSSPSSVLFLLNPQSFLVSVLQKEALMKQVAHQAVVMQFILELASHSKQDPRGCFRQFFYKAKVRRSQEINISSFHANDAQAQHCTSEKYYNSTNIWVFTK